MKKSSWASQRVALVDYELRMLGIRDEAVLSAMGVVPREEFVPPEMREFAYRNVPLPIAAGQTISQPLIVAYMIEALELAPYDRVLEIGAGSGYAAAILSRIAHEVFTVERHRELADDARRRLQRLGYLNVHVRHADGTRGWPEEAPFDAIIVAAGGPRVPSPLLQQLCVGGRLVIPVGEESSQKLIRVVRRGEKEFEHEELMAVRFVPLIGEAGWNEEEPLEKPRATAAVQKRPLSLPEMIRQTAEPISSIDQPDVQNLLERIGAARLVLMGEATHGTSEFYRLRAAITSALIEQKDFQFVAVEADWPDAYRIHDFVTHRQREEPHEWESFARFPTWMWRNLEVLEFIHRLRDFNLDRRSPQQRVGFYGLDLYSLYTSIECVLNYLDRVDAAAAEVARSRYGCLSPWESDPASYGRAALVDRYRTCEGEVVQMLRDLLSRRVELAVKDGEALFDAQVNAQLVADAEKYYRIMYYGSDESWNHRDRHMFATLCSLLERYGPDSKGIIWAHNSHLGDATATQFGAHGQINLGQLCRERFGEEAYLIGQGTDHGTVAAASNWDGPMEVKQVRPSHPDSYERLMHLSEMNAFFLPLTKSRNSQLTSALAARRLERAIGVVYRPESERLSHYFDASLSHQFDEWIWIDETSAIRPLTTQQRAEHEPPHPFAIIDR
jgi:protein-L-isoaspartate(D-aspartate) O-methyltransferase